TAPLADRFYWCDRAAPLARRLAAGVGGRVTPPRTVVSRVGPARLAKQTRSAEAESGRGPGCGAVTTQKIGGRDVSRLEVRRANVAEAARGHPGRRAHAGARHRSDDGAFQRDLRRADQSLPLREARGHLDAWPARRSIESADAPLPAERISGNGH